MNDKWNSYESLSVGDLVILERAGYGDRKQIESVERITKTTITVKGLKFRRSNDWRGGMIIGGSGWNRARIYTASTERIASVKIECERLNLVTTMTYFDGWTDLSLECLKQIHTVINSPSSRLIPVPPVEPSGQAEIRPIAEAGGEK